MQRGKVAEHLRHTVSLPSMLAKAVNRRKCTVKLGNLSKLAPHCRDAYASLDISHPKSGGHGHQHLSSCQTWRHPVHLCSACGNASFHHPVLLADAMIAEDPHSIRAYWIRTGTVRTPGPKPRRPAPKPASGMCPPVYLTGDLLPSLRKCAHLRCYNLSACIVGERSSPKRLLEIGFVSTTVAIT